jgi:inositol-hexakisphosphate/diphosphoinositol-pentakisphosphate 1-kinase
MKKPEQVKGVYEAVQKAKVEALEDFFLLEQLSNILDDKGCATGSKVQLRPYYNKEDKSLQKMQIIVKWGGLLVS